MATGNAASVEMAQGLSSSNLPIASKVMLVIAMLGALALGLAAQSAWQMARIDETYSALTDQTSPGLVRMARANRNLASLMYAGYRAVAYDGQSAADGRTRHCCTRKDG